MNVPSCFGFGFVPVPDSSSYPLPASASELCEKPAQPNHWLQIHPIPPFGDRSLLSGKKTTMLPPNMSRSSFAYIGSQGPSRGMRTEQNRFVDDLVSRLLQEDETYGLNDLLQRSEEHTDSFPSSVRWPRCYDQKDGPDRSRTVDAAATDLAENLRLEEDSVLSAAHGLPIHYGYVGRFQVPAYLEEPPCPNQGDRNLEVHGIASRSSQPPNGGSSSESLSASSVKGSNLDELLRMQSAMGPNTEVKRPITGLHGYNHSRAANPFVDTFNGENVDPLVVGRFPWHQHPVISRGQPPLRSHLKPLNSIPPMPGAMAASYAKQPIAKSAGGPQPVPPPCVFPDPMDLPLLPPPEYLKNMPPPSTVPLPAPTLPELNESSSDLQFTSLKPGQQMMMKTRSWPMKRQPRASVNCQKQPQGWASSPTSRSSLSQQPLAKRSPRAAVPCAPSPSSELQWRFEECQEQIKQLERERKKAEAELVRKFPSKNVSSVNSVTIPRLPPNPSKVDRLIMDHFREHARVSTLCTKMDRLRGGKPLHVRVSRASEAWMAAIRKVQLKRREEIVSSTGESVVASQAVGVKMLDGKEMLVMSECIEILSSATRRMRTALWCAVESTVLYDKLDDVSVAFAKERNLSMQREDA